MRCPKGLGSMGSNDNLKTLRKSPAGYPKSSRGRIRELFTTNSDVGAARKEFSHWTTITHHCLSLFPIASRLGYRTNWLLGLGELLHDTTKFNSQPRDRVSSRFGGVARSHGRRDASAAPRGFTAYSRVLLLQSCKQAFQTGSHKAGPPLTTMVLR